MHRFFVEPELITTSKITFPADISRQIARVLRLTSGTKVSVLDNLGHEISAQLDEVDGTGCTASILDSGICVNEPRVRLTMQLCLTQREKFEWMLQKCTEVGAAAFQPLTSARTLVQKKDDVLDKYDRWKRILKEAAEQSGRGVIPALLPPRKFDELVNSPQPSLTLRLIAWEEERTQGLKAVLRQNGVEQVEILIGPEGGFSAEEAALAVENHYKPISLGRRIMRMETAAVAAAAIILYELDEL